MNTFKGKKGAIIIDGHVQGLANTRSLGEAGIPVVVVDTNKCIAMRSKYCVDFFYCPDYLSDDFTEFLISLSKKRDLKDWVLIPSNDHAVLSISKNKQKLELYYKVITPAIDIIENIYDKSKLLGIAEKCEIPIPLTQYFETVDDPLFATLPFPVITKGRHGLTFYKATGRVAFFAADEQELRDQLKKISSKVNLLGTFTQEVIPFDGTNKTISFTAFCEQGEIKTYWMGIKLREHPIRFGTGTYASSIKIEKCYEQSVLLLKKLNYTGVCEIEYIFDPREKQYKLIEINARTWLWVGLARACGVDLTKMIFDYVNGIPIQYPATYELGVSWINPVSDTIFAIKAILQGELKLTSYIKSLVKGKKVNAFIDLKDLKPALAYFTNSLHFLKNRR